MPSNIRFITASWALVLCALSFSKPSHATEPAADYAATPAIAGDVKSPLQTYFFDAARAGRTDMLQEFITAGYDLDTRDGKGYTALILAAYNGHPEAVDLLLKAGANACAEDQRGNTALMGAIFKGELLIARTLMKSACSPNQANAVGQTPAMYAALFGRLELLDDLKAKGADLSAQDIDGNTAEALARGEIRTRPAR
ncbi:MAG: ankyrin repeat domain-containing protein [Stagnimonas sp.]|nr:ankyrin repeat domain-containing protein [Stagnimonas sp.]